MNTKFHITEHAYKRARERLGWGHHTVDRLLPRVISEGIKHSEAKGGLKKFITEIWSKQQTANNIRIYGDNAWIFCGKRLITIYRLPNNLIKYTRL